MGFLRIGVNVRMVPSGVPVAEHHRAVQPFGVVQVVDQIFEPVFRPNDQPHIAQRCKCAALDGQAVVNGQRVAQVKAFADARAVHVDEPAAVCGVLRQNRRNLFAHPLRRNGGAERILGVKLPVEPFECPRGSQFAAAAAGDSGGVILHPAGGVAAVADAIGGHHADQCGVQHVVVIIILRSDVSEPLRQRLRQARIAVEKQPEHRAIHAVCVQIGGDVQHRAAGVRYAVGVAVGVHHFVVPVVPHPKNRAADQLRQRRRACDFVAERDGGGAHRPVRAAGGRRRAKDSVPHRDGRVGREGQVVPSVRPAQRVAGVQSAVGGDRQALAAALHQE